MRSAPSSALVALRVGMGFAFMVSFLTPPLPILHLTRLDTSHFFLCVKYQTSATLGVFLAVSRHFELKDYLAEALSFTKNVPLPSQASFVHIVRATRTSVSWHFWTRPCAWHQPSSVPFFTPWRWEFSLLGLALTVSAVHCYWPGGGLINIYL